MMLMLVLDCASPSEYCNFIITDFTIFHCYSVCFVLKTLVTLMNT